MKKIMNSSSTTGLNFIQELVTIIRSSVRPIFGLSWDVATAIKSPWTILAPWSQTSTHSFIQVVPQYGDHARWDWGIQTNVESPSYETIRGSFQRRQTRSSGYTRLSPWSYLHTQDLRAYRSSNVWRTFDHCRMWPGFVIGQADKEAW